MTDNTHTDNEEPQVTLTCGNCYNEKPVGVYAIGREVKRFFNEHKTRIGRTFCSMDAIVIRRIEEIQQASKPTKSSKDDGPRQAIHKLANRFVFEAGVRMYNHGVDNNRQALASNLDTQQQLLTSQIIKLFDDYTRSCAKNSGELEDANVAEAYLYSLVVGGDWNLFIKELRAYIATQTTKLQAEARIDEIKREMTLYVDFLSSKDYKAGFSAALDQIDDADRLRIAQLEREHKIGEDGE